LSFKQTNTIPIQLNPDALPKHVAIIMDGNGRWAKKRLLDRIKGHEKGADSVRQIVEACGKIGVPILTLFAFSTENWQRPKKEVTALMVLLKKFLVSERPNLMDKGVRLNAIGDLDRLPKEVRDELDKTIRLTSANDTVTVNLALSYGARAEIVRMARQICEEVKSGRLQSNEITDETVSNYLYTAGIPDPDLLIRTSGEMRISNFMLWQIAYAEIFITDTLWPDFNENEFYEILKRFQMRERRFGRV
jgi:undecaprenyl diphosphate synthase